MSHVEPCPPPVPPSAPWLSSAPYATAQMWNAALDDVIALQFGGKPRVRWGEAGGRLRRDTGPHVRESETRCPDRGRHTHSPQLARRRGERVPTPPPGTMEQWTRCSRAWALLCSALGRGACEVRPGRGATRGPALAEGWSSLMKSCRVREER